VPDCLEIWEPQPPGILRGLSRPVMGLLYLTATTCFDSYEALREMDIRLYMFNIILKNEDKLNRRAV